MLECKEEKDFAENAKFKVSRCTKFRYFNIDETTQIRIVTGGHKHSKQYITMLIKSDEDGIFSEANRTNTSYDITLQDAKEYAAKLYFKHIRQ